MSQRRPFGSEETPMTLHDLRLLDMQLHAGNPDQTQAPADFPEMKPERKRSSKAMMVLAGAACVTAVAAPIAVVYGIYTAPPWPDDQLVNTPLTTSTVPSPSSPDARRPKQRPTMTASSLPSVAVSAAIASELPSLEVPTEPTELPSATTEPTATPTPSVTESTHPKHHHHPAHHHTNHHHHHHVRMVPDVAPTIGLGNG